ncbi:uncharacterized protein WM277_019436 [Molossus nigricans]
MVPTKVAGAHFPGGQWRQTELTSSAPRPLHLPSPSPVNHPALSSQGRARGWSPGSSGGPETSGLVAWKLRGQPTPGAHQQRPLHQLHARGEKRPQSRTQAPRRVENQPLTSSLRRAAIPVPPKWANEDLAGQDRSPVRSCSGSTRIHEQINVFIELWKMEDSTRDTEKAEKKKKDQEDPVDAIAPAINIQDEQFAGLSTTPAFNCLHEEVVQRDSLLARQLPIPLKSSSTEPTPSPPNSQSSEEKEHLNAELEITKAKLCLVMQELEEKTAQLRDSQHKNIQVVVLAQHVKTFSKQLDFLKKKVKHADQVEMELVRCKDELRNLDFYKAGMEELRKQNSILMEAKSMLEEQLTVAWACCDQVEELQTENLQLKSKLRHLELERDAGQKRMEELLEENMVLQTQQKQCMSESAHMVWELEQLSENTDLLDDLSDGRQPPWCLGFSLAVASSSFRG